ncbi:hypothetical protein C5167_008303 [Papaver somniferum]|uniref:Uncharacterized protein n=1 Tax=Papaver somniferum TaxID=3469 RepID=A0A4Y7JXV7_PAPSO|nr:hypothetical protein C5167_008303 [Papaver somniferum]
MMVSSISTTKTDNTRVDDVYNDDDIVDVVAGKQKKKEPVSMVVMEKRRRKRKRDEGEKRKESIKVTVTACVASVNGGVEQTVKDAAPIEKQYPAYPTVMDIKILPHRLPFLMVDRVIEDNAGVSAVAIKNVYHFFPGHFQERPIMPTWSSHG